MMLARIIGRLEEGILAALLAVMTLLTFVQVVLRYLFGTGFVWALEANTYLFAWLILLGISYGVRAHAHIGVDVLVKALPTNARRAVGLVAILLCLAYAVIMLIGSWRLIDKLMLLGALGQDIPVPRWLLSIVLPLGFLLLAVRLLEQAWAIWRGDAAGFELADEAAEVLKEQGLAGRRGSAERDGEPDGAAP